MTDWFVREYNKRLPPRQDLNAIIAVPRLDAIEQPMRLDMLSDLAAHAVNGWHCRYSGPRTVEQEAFDALLIACTTSC